MYIRRNGKKPLLCVIEECSSFGLQLSQSSCCCFQGSIEPQVDFFSLVHWNSQSHSLFAESAQHFLVLIQILPFSTPAGDSRSRHCTPGCHTVEWLLCKDHSLLRPSWKHSEAVSDLCDHITMLQVNIYVLSVYRTAAGKYVCMF